MRQILPTKSPWITVIWIPLKSGGCIAPQTRPVCGAQLGAPTAARKSRIAKEWGLHSYMQPGLTEFQRLNGLGSGVVAPGFNLILGGLRRIGELSPLLGHCGAGSIWWTADPNAALGLRHLMMACAATDGRHAQRDLG